jgi:hypothetical protein
MSVTENPRDFPRALRMPCEQAATRHHRHVQEEFTRFAGDCRVLLDELPEWALVVPVGRVDTYWRWRTGPPSSARHHQAAWGMRVGFGGHGEYGVLGARFEPHEHPYLRVRVAVTTMTGIPGEEPFTHARVGLPHEVAGGALAGILQEAERLGPGVVRLDWAAVHPVDSSWEAFRVLAIGVARLLSRPDVTHIPSDLLPHFGGQTPAAPGTPAS